MAQRDRVIPVAGIKVKHTNLKKTIKTYILKSNLYIFSENSLYNL